jgi:hypothetical protein
MVGLNAYGHERLTVVFPTRVRRRALQHAFEEALDEAAEDGVQLEFDGLEVGSASDDSAHRFHSALSGLSSLADVRSSAPAGSLANAYDAEADPQEASRMAHPRYAAEQAIAAVRAGLSERDLSQLRRRFAAMNHPDRVPPELRSEAERAMASVNAEIDAALKRIASGSA